MKKFLAQTYLWFLLALLYAPILIIGIFVIGAIAIGLVFFLVGAGIPGGAEFVANFDPMYFVYGIIMTICPMIIGFLFAKYVLKLSLLNNLGSLTGAMTSTPALGTLIGVAKTDDVAAAYAATYPIALIAVVLVSQFLIILF